MGAAFRISDGIILEKAFGMINHIIPTEILKIRHMTIPSKIVLDQTIESASPLAFYQIMENAL